MAATTTWTSSTVQPDSGVIYTRPISSLVSLPAPPSFAIPTFPLPTPPLESWNLDVLEELSASMKHLQLENKTKRISADVDSKADLLILLNGGQHIQMIRGYFTCSPRRPLYYLLKSLMDCWPFPKCMIRRHYGCQLPPPSRIEDMTVRVGKNQLMDTNMILDHESHSVITIENRSTSPLPPSSSTSNSSSSNSSTSDGVVTVDTNE